jgi:uncharacterized protein with NRDE domain
MCIVALAWQVLEDTPICLISNRDEFYSRETQALHKWKDQDILAGRDLEQGGTWMGVTPTGRWAVLTNFRNAEDKTTYPTSRGHLVSDFLSSDLTPIRFAKQLESKQRDYAGFNFICGDKHQAVYMSNRGEAPQVLARGVYVVSNGLMTEHWEKTRHLRKRFTQEFLPLLQQPTHADLEFAVWDILEDQRKILPELLPETGVSLEMEQLLSSTFIQSPNYGTRCSNFLRLKDHTWQWLEKNQQGTDAGNVIQLTTAIVS